MKDRIEMLIGRYTAAQVELNEAIIQAYPVGAVVRVVMNTAHGERVHLIQITGHGSSWAYTTSLRGKNIATGKQRSFDVRDILDETD